WANATNTTEAYKRLLEETRIRDNIEREDLREAHERGVDALRTLEESYKNATKQAESNTKARGRDTLEKQLHNATRDYNNSARRIRQIETDEKYRVIKAADHNA
ncbi:unnamed protein product, partial [Amoebophrya sp. A25]